MITEDKIIEDIKYLFSKINWSASFLDAKAINIMNILCAEVGRIKQEEHQRLKKLLNDATHWMYYDGRHWIMKDMILEFLEDEK